MCLQDTSSTYALKHITSPDNWWAFWESVNTGVWHEGYRLAELRLMAEHFSHIVEDMQMAIYGLYSVCDAYKV